MRKIILAMVFGFALFLANCGAPIVVKDKDVTENKNTLVLFDFEEEQEVKALFKENGPEEGNKDFPVERSTENATSGKYSLKVVFPNEGTWPGVHFIKFNTDWSEYTYLKVDIFNPAKEVVPLNFSSADKDSGITAEDYFGDNKLRLNFAVKLRPGKNTLKLKIAGALVESDERSVNLKEMRRFALFLMDRPDNAVLYIDNIRLEK